MDVRWGTKSPNSARLFDLFEDVLEQITFGVGILAVKLQSVHQRDHLGEHRGFRDVKTRAAHEIGGRAGRNFLKKRKYLVLDKAYQGLTGKTPGPDGPAESILRDTRLALLGGIQRILELPGAGNNALIRLLENVGALRILRIDPFN